ncbi:MULTISPECIES: HAMP domain-containing sensor histidine kinase [unclassified Sporolactobacillus]|uniref:HAMP domain-containing sensor histidine kinase n=1 Tax=unclassified Sporolactobacillus TaxID=2628533 RepID=UPI002367BA50|nr:HAMP domain-containing sensor histidine kinase [Sporolactobacillus sp. CQH2019]MDD9146935.1 HAMP domain-containing sensor histidine kinase [Sporolactobacillus sp. CQH2019]
MKNKKAHTTLWLYFAIVVFLIMLVTAMIMTIIAFILLHFGYLNPSDRTPLIPISILMFMSIVIGTVISLFVGKKILKPITQFSKAAKQVAKGDFNIKLNETSHINEIHELTRNFNIMVHELSSIETLRNDFVVNVSHEFKTPITTIEGYATLLQDKTLSDKDKDEYIQMILESTRQLTTLCGNILILSKLENQGLVMDKQTFRLDEQIRQAILLLEPNWSKKNINFEIDLINMTYLGKEDLLMQVWINLLDNAIKFSKQDGTVNVSLIQDQGMIRVDISDNGIGMTEAVIHHIFDKFYQGNTTRSSSGNGLGLPLVKKIIELCDGRITVKSKYNEGTHFTVFLPL